MKTILTIRVPRINKATIITFVTGVLIFWTTIITIAYYACSYLATII
jgi:hypothetical protein